MMFSRAERVMFVQLKTGHGADKGPAWISRVRFNKSWKTAYWHGKTLRRWPGMFDANFYDVEPTRSTGSRDRTVMEPIPATAISVQRSTTISVSYTSSSSEERPYLAGNAAKQVLLTLVRNRVAAMVMSRVRWR
jgi:hypothetical protein